MIRHYLILLIVLFALPLFSLSQEFLLLGEVYDEESGKPLAFVNILVNGGNLGTSTDIDGKFQVLSKDSIRFIDLTYVGYESRKVLIGRKLQKIIIKMRSKQINLTEVQILPKENPADAIIEKVIAYRDLNNPEKQRSFKYQSYNKYTFTAAIDSIDKTDLRTSDTVYTNISKFLEKQHFFIMESVTERKFLFPDKNYERILASKASGFKDPVFILFASQLQSFSVYNDYFMIGSKRYLNPISKGSVKKYRFTIQDTTYFEKDTVFIISFEPRKNKNFDGLKGLLYINNYKWAVQNVIASPAIEESGINVSIQQKYVLIDNEQWFPVQLNTDITLRNFTLNQMTFIGNMRGYLHDITINPELLKKEFSSIVVELDDQATKRDEIYWNRYRIDSLSIKDVNTYRVIDSLGEVLHFDRLSRNIESIVQGKFPLGFVDIELGQHLRYNIDEGLRLGIGLYTNNQLSKRFSIGGYGAYGFKDDELKYGSDLILHLFPAKELDLSFSYKHDLTSAGGEKYIEDKLKTGGNIIEEIFIDRWDFTTKQRIRLDFRTLKFMKVNFSLSQNRKTPQYNYAHGFRTNRLSIKVKEFNFAEISAGIRYAYGEKLIKTPYGITSMGTNYPIIWLQYTKGLNDFLNGDYQYDRIDMAFQKSILVKNLGYSRFTLIAGIINGDVPYTNLFNLPSGFNNTALFIPNSFVTMRVNEFTANRFVSIFYSHSFGKLLLNTKIIHPEIQFLVHTCFADLEYLDNHFNIDLNTIKEGYYESGLLLNNLLDFSFYSFGLGAFYRYGPYAYNKAVDNYAFIWTITIPILSNF